jgi:hypothetical protein
MSFATLCLTWFIVRLATPYSGSLREIIGNKWPAYDGRVFSKSEADIYQLEKDTIAA